MMKWVNVNNGLPAQWANVFIRFQDGSYSAGYVISDREPWYEAATEEEIDATALRGAVTHWMTPEPPADCIRD